MMSSIIQKSVASESEMPLLYTIHEESREQLLFEDLEV